MTDDDDVVQLLLMIPYSAFISQLFNFAKFDSFAEIISVKIWTATVR